MTVSFRSGLSNTPTLVRLNDRLKSRVVGTGLGESGKAALCRNAQERLFLQFHGLGTQTGAAGPLAGKQELKAQNSASSAF